MTARCSSNRWIHNGTRAQVWRALYTLGPGSLGVDELRAALPDMGERVLHTTVFRLRRDKHIATGQRGKYHIHEGAVPPKMQPDALLAFVLPHAFEARALAWLADISGGVDSDVLAGLMLLPHVTTMDHMAPLVASGRVHQVVDEKRLNVRYTLAPEAQQ